jgi:hypothetical protein
MLTNLYDKNNNIVKIIQIPEVYNTNLPDIILWDMRFFILDKTQSTAELYYREGYCLTILSREDLDEIKK